MSKEKTESVNEKTTTEPTTAVKAEAEVKTEAEAEGKGKADSKAVAVPSFTIKELLEVGAHYGHKTMRWNPKMSPYIYGVNNGSHIINLQKTAPLFKKALSIIFEVVKKNGRVLFVGTKKQASANIAAAAKSCGQYYVNHRWLGGMLTNWKTVSKSIDTLRDLQKQLEEVDSLFLKKKEILVLKRKENKLNLSLGGIMDMGGRPDILFVIDTNIEALAIKEASILGIPIIAIVDSNSNPDGIDYPVPGNDDSIKAINFYCNLIAEASLAGIKESLRKGGVSSESSEKVLDGKKFSDDKKFKKKNFVIVPGDSSRKSKSKEDNKPGEAESAKTSDAAKDKVSAKDTKGEKSGIEKSSDNKAVTATKGSEKAKPSEVSKKDKTEESKPESS